VLGRLLSPSTLLDPARTAATVQRFAPYLSTDRGLDADYLVGLGFVLGDAKANGIGFVALPVAGTRTAAGSARSPSKTAAIQRIRTAFAPDTVTRLARLTGVRRP
jgi:hypothetical protein